MLNKREKNLMLNNYARIVKKSVDEITDSQYLTETIMQNIYKINDNVDYQVKQLYNEKLENLLFIKRIALSSIAVILILCVIISTIYIKRPTQLNLNQKVEVLDINKNENLQNIQTNLKSRYSYLSTKNKISQLIINKYNNENK